MGERREGEGRGEKGREEGKGEGKKGERELTPNSKANLRLWVQQ